MPLIPGSNVSDTIRELHSGKTFAHTASKFGKERANKQAIAIALSNARKGHLAAGGVVPHFDAGGATTDAVQQVISALNAGAGSGGVAGAQSTGTTGQATGTTGQTAAVTPGVTNTAAPSSVAATASTAPAAANTQAQNQGVAPAAAAVPAAPATGVVATTPNNPIQKPLMARGGAAKRAFGGFSMAQGPNLAPPPYMRGVQRQLHVGPVLSNVPGRTDNHRVKVPAGSYVLPAQHVASMGSGNTLAGMSLASKMFSGPYGVGAPKMPHGAGPPKPPKPITHFWAGGYSEGGARGTDRFEPVDVDISGGEYVIPPQAIIAKFGSLKAGHKILDKWVMDTRKNEIATQKKLPPPAKRWTGGGVGLEIALRWAA